MGRNWHKGEFSWIEMEGWVWNDPTIWLLGLENRNHIIISISIQISRKRSQEE